MSLPLFLVWLHLIAAVLLTGFALYWLVLRLAPIPPGQGIERRELLAAAHAARWPHVGVPWKFRIPVPLLALLATLFLAATGLLLGDVAVDPGLWRAKLAFVALLALVQLVFLVRIADWTIFAQLPLVLLIILLSAVALRS